MTLTDTYTLADGTKIPKIGFGTWRSKEGNEAYDSVKIALESGYIHIDTAAFYGNEKSVGKAIKDSTLDRDKIFITTKLWNTITTYDDTKLALDESLDKLGLDYVDLYLIHWPNPAPNRPNNKKRNADVWRAMEEGVKEGKIRAIGVSNFLPHHLDDLLETAKIKPVINQIFVNPSDQQEEVVAYNKAHNILTEAYSPLGKGEIFEIRELADVAKKYDKTIAQLVLRWSLDKGYLPLPKSVTDSRIRENTEIFDFKLSEEDTIIIDGLHGKTGLAKNPDETDF